MDRAESFILEGQSFIYPAVTAGVFMAMLVWERLAPRRDMAGTGVTRWLTNMGLGFANMLMVRFLAPAVVVGSAYLASGAGVGLFNTIEVPPAAAFILAIILLDFGIYGQHVVMHLVPLFWRVHQVHHTDTAFDVSTGIRFHPVEIFLSLGFKVIFVLVIGAPIAAVIVYEMLLTAAAIFTHGNVRIAAILERLVRYGLVTPDMHRIHHSVLAREYNSNFGSLLSVWDRLCRTYTQAAAEDDRKMEIGLSIFRSRRDQLPDRLLIQCFRPQAESRDES